MQTLRLRPFLYFAMGIAVTVAAAWSLSAWRASAAVSADESTFVSVSPTRILDTREDIGLPGPFVSPVAQDLQVTGTIATKSGTIVVVPSGATGVVLNVTAVGPTADGFVSIRPADAPGVPTTSNLNFAAGDVIPNSVTVQLPTSGGDAGRIEITYDALGQAGPTTEMLVDVVGYTKNAGLASLQAEVTALQVQVAQLVNHGVGLDEMNAMVQDNRPFLVPPLADAACASITDTGATGTVAGSRVLPLSSRLSGGAPNIGFVLNGVTTTTNGQATIQFCNFTGGATLSPTAFSVSYITLGP